MALLTTPISAGNGPAEERRVLLQRLDSLAVETQALRSQGHPLEKLENQSAALAKDLTQVPEVPGPGATSDVSDHHPRTGGFHRPAIARRTWRTPVGLFDWAVVAAAGAGLLAATLLLVAVLRRRRRQPGVPGRPPAGTPPAANARPGAAARSNAARETTGRNTRSAAHDASVEVVRKKIAQARPRQPAGQTPPGLRSREQKPPAGALGVLPVGGGLAAGPARPPVMSPIRAASAKKPPGLAAAPHQPSPAPSTPRELIPKDRPPAADSVKTPVACTAPVGESLVRPPLPAATARLVAKLADGKAPSPLRGPAQKVERLRSAPRSALAATGPEQSEREDEGEEVFVPPRTTRAAAALTPIPGPRAVRAVPDVDEPPPLDEEIASLTTEDLKKRILAEAGRKLSVAAIAKRYRLSTDYVSLIIKFSKSIREGE